jgi:uncharacterized protein (DUF302 family)
VNETGLVTVSSAYPASEALERLQTAIRAAGMTVFAIFDHAAAAKEAGLSLRPTTVVAFGNPADGTKLMQANQVAGLDLPLKILVWQDELNMTRLTFSDPRWLAERYSLAGATAPVTAAMTKLLDSLVQQAGAATARAS